jgi:D-alanyl-lipoteichoic acid acyltransferase DltB (MBOAT superfamily)
MLFTSIEFFGFLAVALVVFALLPPSWRWLWLLIASCAFYGASQPFNLIYLGGVTAAVLVCGAGVIAARRPAMEKAWLTAGLVIVLGSLAAFKFYDFAAGELERLVGTVVAVQMPRLGATAPAGYSFYAFSAASYLIDLFQRRLPAHQPGGCALYLSYFPKILAGPIERAPGFVGQLRKPLRLDPAQWTFGCQLIVWGLFKKVVIADNLAPVVDRSFAVAGFAPPLELLIGSYFFAFQIYCDFSGYTDIAIGISLLFGIRLMENFRRPYLARTTAEFWAERWHISLGRWFRDYLYIPLGGSQRGQLRRYFNIMAVFVVSGLWHAGLGYGVGWTFLAWGALNGLYQWIGIATRSFWQRMALLMPRTSKSRSLVLFRVLLTFHLITIAWIFFRAKTVADALLILRKIAENMGELPSLLVRYPFTSEHMLGGGLIVLLLAVEIGDERKSIHLRLMEAPRWLRWSTYYLVIFAMLILGRWQAKEFIYMQF